MLASASTQVNIIRVQALCLCTYTPKSNHLWTCTYMSAFVPSTMGYMSIVNTMPRRQQPQCVHTCQHWLQRKSSCASTTTCIRLSTFTTKSVLRACLHVRTFLHCLRSLNVRTCQSSTQAQCGVDNNLNISCHNSHRLYWHVYTCQHQLQRKSTSTSFMSMHIYTKAKSSMDIYVHVSICAFDLSTNAWVHVNRKHCLVYMSALAYTQVIIVCTSITCMSKHIYYKVCLACMSTCTYIPSLPSILACAYMSIVNPSPMR